MRIVIVGDGKVGNTLASRLAEEQHDVTIIDNNPTVLQRSSERMDVSTIPGNGAAYDVQREAGVDKADLLIAATSSDERNLICCLVAKKLGAKSTVARVRNPEYSNQIRFIQKELGLSMHVNPESSTAGEISRALRYPDAIKVSPFAHGRVELLEMRLDANSPLDGLTLKEFRQKYPFTLLICAVMRNDTVTIPRGDFTLASGDRVLMMGTPMELNRYFNKRYPNRVRTRNVMIAGGGRIGYYLASQLLAIGMRVKIIEKDAQRCLELCELLPKAQVLHGDIREHDFLMEEGLDEMDAFVALTGRDEENIIVSMYAAGCNVPRVVTKVNDSDLVAMAERLGLNTVVSPKTITSDLIARYVRALGNSQGSAMETLYRLMDGHVEALGFHVGDDIEFLNIPLKDLHLRKGTLLACIVRGPHVIVPDGNAVIQAGDQVIVATANGELDNLKDLVAKL